MRDNFPSNTRGELRLVTGIANAADKFHNKERSVMMELESDCVYSVQEYHFNIIWRTRCHMYVFCRLD